MNRLSAWLLPLLIMFFATGTMPVTAGETTRRGIVAEIAVSGDGRVMAVSYAADEIGYPIDFFDTTTLELLGSMDTTQHEFSTFALDRTGNRLIGTGSVGEIGLYDRRDDRFTVLRSGDEGALLGRFRWSPADASVVAFILGDSIQFLNIDTREQLGSIKSNIGAFSNFAFHPDGDSIVTSSFIDENIWDSAPHFGVEIWDWDRLPASGVMLTVPSITLEGAGGGAVAWSPDGQRIAMLGLLGLSIYDVSKQQFEVTNLRAWPESLAWLLAWSPDGQYIATNGSYIAVLDATTYKFVRQVSETPSVKDLVWSPNGAYIYAQNLIGPEGLGVFEAAASPAVPTSTERGLVSELSVSGDGRVMAVAYFSHETAYPVDFIDTATLELLGSVSNNQLGFAGFALDYEGNRLIGTGFSGELVIYDRRDGNITVLREGGHFGSLGEIKWSPTDSSIIAYVFGGIVDLIDINTGEFLWSVRSNIGRINDFAFHPSGNGLVTSTYVPAILEFPSVVGVEIWNQPPQSGDVLVTPDITLEGRGGGLVRWSPDGQRIAMIEAEGFSIYNVSKQQFEAMNLRTEPDTRLSALVWSPDGRYIASNGENVSIWDATTYTFLGHISETSSVRSIAWSPDGTRVYGQNLGGPGGIGVFDAAPAQLPR